MDDTPDKIRRNLVVVSAALIISKFLGVNFSGANLPILGDTLSVIGEKDRIWWAVLFLWAYLAYRFFSLKDTRENLLSLLPDVRHRYHEQKIQDYKNAIARAMTQKRSFLCNAVIVEKIDAFNIHEVIPIAHQKKITSRTQILKVSETLPPFSIKKTTFKYKTRFDFEAHVDTPHRYGSDGNLIAPAEEVVSFFSASHWANLTVHPELKCAIANGVAEIEILIWNYPIQYVATLTKMVLTEKFSETFVAIMIAALGLAVSISYIINPPHLTKPASTWCKPMKYADAGRSAAK